MPRLLVLGYFGAGNLGDDAVLTAWLKSHAGWLRDQTLRLTIVSRSADPLGGFVETAELTPLMEATVSPLEALRLDPGEFDALVAPGGSLLQDSTSLRSLVLYLTIIERFRASKHGVFMLNQGLGPLRHAVSRIAAGAALARATMISFRDVESKALARCLAALSGRRDILLSCDPVAATPRTLEPSRLEPLGLDQPYFVVVPKGTPPGLPGAAAAIAGQAGLQPVVVPLHESQDLTVARTLAEGLPSGCLITAETASKAGPPNSVRINVLASASLVISVRLHGLIIAAANGVPALGLAYDPKVEAFCAEMGYHCLPLDSGAARIAGFAETALAGFDAAVQANRLAAMRARYEAAQQRFIEVWSA